MQIKTERKTKVAVVEDDARIRSVLLEVLDNNEDCECVGMFANATSACADLPACRPDVILMDVNLPDFSGVECVVRISAQLPDCQIIMLTSYQDPETIFQALSAGAHGYLVKPVLPARLLDAICEIREGGVPMSRTIARKVVDVFRRSGSAPAPAGKTPSDDLELAPRERQVIDLLVTGMSYKEIADELTISISTVSTYVQRIYEKLHVRTRREIIARYKSI